VIIGAIAAGAFFSMLHVMRFYAIASIAFDIPMVVYYGFKKSFSYDNKVIYRFWLPKIILSLMLVVSVWTGYIWITLILIILYFLHLVTNQQDDLVSIFKFVNNKLFKRSV